MHADCPRAYELYYYGGRGGHDLYAERDRKLIYRLKKLSKLAWWLDELFGGAIRSCIPWEAKAFRAELFRQFKIGRRQVLSGDWQSDPGFLNLEEVYYGEGDPGELFEQAWQEVLRRCELLEQGALGEHLKSMTELETVKFRQPLAVGVGLVEAWMSPVQIWRRGNLLHFLNRMNADAEGYTGALQCVWAMRALKTPPERVYFISYDFGDGIYREYPAKELEISLSLQYIEKRAMELYSPDYPRRKDYCPQCRFREYCQG